MSEQVNEAVASEKSAKVSLKTVLTVHKEFWNESGGKATLNEVAEYLGMSLGNLRVRLYQARAELAKQGVELKLLKAAKGPRKPRKPRNDFAELAEIVKDMEPVEPEVTPEVESA